MPQDNEFYQDPDVFQGLAEDTNYLKFLALNGINEMPKPFRAIPGRPEKPSYTSQEDNRTGIYFPELGTVGFAVAPGVAVCWVKKDRLRLFDRYGNFLDLVIPGQIGGDFALSLPSQTGKLLLREQLITEELIGTKNGVNTSFTVTDPVHQLHSITLNGVGDISYVSWTPDSNALTWTFATIPDTGDKVYATYIKA